MLPPQKTSPPTIAAGDLSFEVKHFLRMFNKDFLTAIRIVDTEVLYIIS
jgi:hypothetical protein